jgi:integrase
MASTKTTESVNFYLKHCAGYANHTIYLQFKFDGHRLRYYLKQSIEKSKWNVKKQRSRDGNIKTADGKHGLNDLLNNLADVCIAAYHTELANGNPTPAQLKKHLDAFMAQNHDAERLEAERPTFKNLVDRFIAGEIKHKGKDKAANTIKTYKTAQGHFLDFEKATGYKVDFETINLDFYYKFVNYLQHTANLSTNAIGKIVQILKVFMAEGVDLNLTNNLEFRKKKFAVTREETDAVYLSEDEIMTLYKHDFGDNKRLEQVRDLFVFGCWVGLRFSDYNNVKPENIIDVNGEKFIRIKTKKTGAVVYVPCNPVVMAIFKRYEKSPNKLPKSISDVKFNLYIKEACKAAGLTETGRLLNEPDAELWQHVTSHTARRSFATNYYLEGFPTTDLMKITGHKTEKSFRQYIKVTKLDAAKRMAEHNRRKNWAAIVGGLNEKMKVAS